MMKSLNMHVYNQAFAKLTALGCPAKADPNRVAKTKPPATADDHFREHAMHGSLERMIAIGTKADPNSREPLTLRTALHKAAFWGHDHVVKYLISRKVDIDAQDMDGATALHGAMQFGKNLLAFASSVCCRPPTFSRLPNRSQTHNRAAPQCRCELDDQEQARTEST